MSMAEDTNSSRAGMVPGLQKAYGTYVSGTAARCQPDFMYGAVASGEVDVIAGYTSYGLIAKYDLVVLEDTKHAILRPYDAILLLAPKRAGDQALQTATGAAARPHRYISDARGQSARRRGRRRLVARRRGALAVGADRDALTRSGVCNIWIDGVYSQV